MALRSCLHSFLRSNRMWLLVAILGLWLFGCNNSSTNSDTPGDTGNDGGVIIGDGTDTGGDTGNDGGVIIDDGTDTGGDTGNDGGVIIDDGTDTGGDTGNDGGVDTGGDGDGNTGGGVVTSGDIVVLAWNDLGMHCLNPTYDQLIILPPYNTLWAQVIERGNPPRVVTSGYQVTYSILDNTTSLNKLSYDQFWDPAVLALFGAQGLASGHRLEPA